MKRVITVEEFIGRLSMYKRKDYVVTIENGAVYVGPYNGLQQEYRTNEFFLVSRDKTLVLSSDEEEDMVED